MWNLSSLTRERTCAPCLGNVEYQPLDSQGSPLPPFFLKGSEFKLIWRISSEPLDNWDTPGYYETVTGS